MSGKTIIALAVVAAVGVASRPAMAQAQSTSVRAQSATAQAGGENVFSYPVGDVRVVLLSEGQSEGNAGVLIDVPAEVTGRYLSEAGTYPSATNAFAVVTPEGTILIDAGVGRALDENLAAAGIGSPDAIWLTHMHGDHIGGLLRDGARAFEGVPLSLGAVEAAYWAEQEGDAKRVLDNIYRPGTLELYTLENVPLDRDGIFAVEAYGHTPGHTMFLVVSDGRKLLVWGDLTHAMAVQMPHPEISVRYDVDPDAARASRLKILEYAAANRIPIAGMHIAWPGIGFVEKAAQGYKFTPVADRR